MRVQIMLACQLCKHRACRVWCLKASLLNTWVDCRKGGYGLQHSLLLFVVYAVAPGSLQHCEYPPYMILITLSLRPVKARTVHAEANPELRCRAIQGLPVLCFLTYETGF